MAKYLSACLALFLAGCGLITSQSVYEGFRTQQSVKDAGSQPKAEPMEPYDTYEKERQKAKSQQ